MRRARMSNSASRSVFRKGNDRIHRKNFVNAGLMRGGNRLV